LTNTNSVLSRTLKNWFVI